MSDRIVIASNPVGNRVEWRWGIRLPALGLWISPLPPDPEETREAAIRAANDAAAGLGLDVTEIQE